MWSDGERMRNGKNTKGMKRKKELQKERKKGRVGKRERCRG